MCFSPYLGIGRGGGGVSQGIRIQPAMQFFTLDNSKNKFAKLIFLLP